MHQRRTLAAVTILWVSGITLTALVVGHKTQSIDTHALLSLHAHTGLSVQNVAKYVSYLGDPAIVALIAAILIAGALQRRNWWQLWFFTTSIGGAALLDIALKQLIARPRPQLWQQLVTEMNFSYPSGHAIGSAALGIVIAVVLAEKYHRGAVIGGCVIYIILVGGSRLVLGVHYPSDIIGAWLLGAAWVGTIYLVLLRIMASNKISINSA